MHAGELPRRNYTRFRTRRKFENENAQISLLPNNCALLRTHSHCDMFRLLFMAIFREHQYIFCILFCSVYSVLLCIFCFVLHIPLFCIFCIVLYILFRSVYSFVLYIMNCSVYSLSFCIFFCSVYYELFCIFCFVLYILFSSCQLAFSDYPD
jgi:hypothetical protein